MGWRGISQLKGDREGELAFGAGALGRRYIALNARGRSRKIIFEPIKGYFFFLQSQKNKPPNVMFSNPNSWTFYETELKIPIWKQTQNNSQRSLLTQGWHTWAATCHTFLKKEESLPTKYFFVHSLLLTKAC